MTAEGTRRTAGSLPAAPRRRAGRTGRAMGVAALALGLFLVGGVGVFTAVRPDELPPPVAAVRRAAPALQVRPVIEAGSLDRLIGDLQARLRAYPDDWESYASLGFAYVQQARVTADPAYYPRAEEALRRSLDLRGEDNFGAALGLGTLALARHDFAAGLMWGERARDLNPHSSTPYGVIGDALIELGRYDEGFDALQRMVDLRPDLASYARASYALELQGNVPSAVEAMDLAFGAAGTRADMAWTLHQLGDLFFNSGRLDEAERHYRRAIAADQTFAPAEAGLARVAAARGRTGEAVERYESVVARFPLPEHVMALADLYTVAGRDDDARRQLDLVEAERTLFESNGVNVDLEFALFSADHELDVVDGLATARAEWARRKSVHVADALAWQLHANGRYEEALQMSEQALRLGTRNALFLFHRGMIERALGRRDAAAASLRRALDINPHFSILWADTAAETLAELGAGR